MLAHPQMVGMQHAACVALDAVIRGNDESRTHAVHAGAVVGRCRSTL